MSKLILPSFWIYMTLKKKPFENIAGKGENAVNFTNIFSFSTLFSILAKTTFNFPVTFELSSANGFNLDQSKNLSFGIG